MATGHGHHPALLTQRVTGSQRRIDDGDGRTIRVRAGDGVMNVLYSSPSFLQRGHIPQGC